jgi:carboxyl-terminal processing protease
MSTTAGVASRAPALPSLRAASARRSSRRASALRFRVSALGRGADDRVSPAREADLAVPPEPPASSPPGPARRPPLLLERFAPPLAALAASLAVSLAPCPAPASAITANNLLFLEAWRAVDKAYVDKTFNGVSWFKYREDTVKKTPMDSTEETYAAIRAMLAKLDDPFTRFLEPEKYAQLSESTMSANVTGVGVEMAYGDDADATSAVSRVALDVVRSASAARDAPIVVVAPTPGGPADVAGVRPRDVIIAVDGVPVAGLSLYEVADALRGPENSKVRVDLTRDEGLGERKTVAIEVTRKKYALVPVQSALCAPPGTEESGGAKRAVEYVRLTTFNQLSGAKVKAAIDEGVRGGADAFVLDLRNNSGGLFPGALEIAEAFMNKVTIVSIADSNGVRDVFEAGTNATAPASAPLTVLVNEGTASASEVLAGALRDNGRAKVVGTTTFGKGLIQTVVPLADGSAVSVTVAKYQTPSGADINKVGIAPDAPAPKIAAEEPGGEERELPATPEGFCDALAKDPDLADKLFA